VVKLAGDEREFEEIPINEVELDDTGEEIDIIPNDNTSERCSLTVVQLLEKLDQFMPGAANYQIFASHATIELGKKYTARLDVPVVALGIAESTRRLGLLEESSKIDGETQQGAPRDAQAPQ
jgi:hypothetical protein